MKPLPNQIKPNQTILWPFIGVFNLFFGQNPKKPTVSDLTEHIPSNYTYVPSHFHWSHTWTNLLTLDMLLTTCVFSKEGGRKEGRTHSVIHIDYGLMTSISTNTFQIASTLIKFKKSTQSKFWILVLIKNVKNFMSGYLFLVHWFINVKEPREQLI